AVDDAGDTIEHHAHARPPASSREFGVGVRCDAIQSSMAATWSVDRRRPSLERRQTMSSALRAHSLAMRYFTSAAVSVAPKDGPRSAKDFAAPSSFEARVP